MNLSSSEKNSPDALVFDSEIESEVLALISERLAHDCGNLLARILAIGEEFQFHMEDGTPFLEGPSAMRQNVMQAKELMRRIAELPRKSGPSGCHDLNVLVDEAAELIRKFLPRSVQLETRSAGELLPVDVDPVAFRWIAIELAWLAAAVCHQSGNLSLVTSRQSRPGRSGFCLVVAAADPARPLIRPSKSAPDRVDRFVERCGAVLSVENGTAFRLWLPEAGMA